MSDTDAELPKYRLLTGIDDAAFCKRVSAELEKGYVLYGSPACTINPETGEMRVAQAIIRPELKP
ncbi:MAG: DUF1737 domain-containing protein [Rhodospirillales bacterium]|nr:DUF1737 domain-containing protein [Rhodospirillales bacterium]